MADVDSGYILDAINSVRDQIGRPVDIYTAVRSACSICTASGFYDSFTDHSVYFKCPECQGTFWKRAMSATTITARVHWTSNEGITATPGGKFFSGDAYIHVGPQYHALLQDSQNGGKVVVDGQEMHVIRINPEGVPVVNRYKAILKGAGSSPQG